MNNTPTQMHGQAMAEFSVTAVFVLVPIFLLIPLVGKYIDLRHTAVQSARQAAWERTVWFERSASGVDTVPKASSAPFRSDIEIERVAVNRVMGASGRGLDVGDWDVDLVEQDLNPLWRDHRGQQMVRLSDPEPVTALGTDRDLPTNGFLFFETVETVEDGINGVLAYANAPIDAAESALSSIGLNVNLPSAPQIDIFSKYHLEGFYAPRTEIPINDMPGVANFGQAGGPFENLGLRMQGRAALIADGWTAEGSTQFAEWTDDYVPTKAIAPAFTPMQRLIEAATIPVLGFGLAPELIPSSLQMGKIHMGEVPTSDVEPDCPDNVCSYE